MHIYNCMHSCKCYLNYWIFGKKPNIHHYGNSEINNETC